MWNHIHIHVRVEIWLRQGQGMGSGCVNGRGWGWGRVWDLHVPVTRNTAGMTCRPDGRPGEIMARGDKSPVQCWQFHHGMGKRPHKTTCDPHLRGR